MYWMNGKLYRNDVLSLSPFDRGFTLGDGLFETILIRNNKPCFWQAHMKRLIASASKLSIPLPVDAQQLRSGVDQLLEGREGKQQDYALRISLSRGSAGRGLALPDQEEMEPSVVMVLAPYQAVATAPQRIIVSSIRRNEGSPTSQLKSLNYLDNILAKEEASLAGFDDALLLNNREEIACLTIANVFFLKGERVFTPPVSAGILPGIVRSILCTSILPDIARLEVKPITLKDIRGSYFFTTNSLQGLRGACLYQEGKTLTGEEQSPPLFLNIKRAYNALLEQEYLEGA